MIVCAHRINTIEELEKVESKYGIEFDVREGPHNGIVVTHDPWTQGPNLDEFLRHCHHAFYIVNIKCEGIEPVVLDLLHRNGIQNFFLLDCSFPMIHKLATMGENRLAIRISEYEGLDTAYQMQGRVQWVWIDVFTSLPIDVERCSNLRRMGYKLCLVSPELQRQPQKLDTYKDSIGYYIDMVCTKFTDKWSSETSLLASKEPQQPAFP